MSRGVVDRCAPGLMRLRQQDAPGDGDRAAPDVADATCEDPYGCPLVPRGSAEDASVRRCSGRQKGCSPKSPQIQRKRHDPYTRCADGEGVYGSRVYGPFPLIFQASANAPAVEWRNGGKRGKGHKGTWQQRSCGPSASLRSLAALRDAVGRHSRQVPPLASLAGPSVAALPPAMPSAALEWRTPRLPRRICPQVDDAAKGAARRWITWRCAPGLSEEDGPSAGPLRGPVGAVPDTVHQ